MQKTKKLMLATVMLTMTMTTPIHLMACGEQNAISLQKKTDYLSAHNAPRMPSIMYIEAYYDSELLNVFVNLSNAGEDVDVSIENLDSGEMFNYSVAGSGGTALPISGTDGYWRITFTLPNGDQYVGEFEI